VLSFYPPIAEKVNQWIASAGLLGMVVLAVLGNHFSDLFKPANSKEPTSLPKSIREKYQRGLFGPQPAAHAADAKGEHVTQVFLFAALEEIVWTQRQTLTEDGNGWLTTN
jgi:hypothetical protein